MGWLFILRTLSKLTLQENFIGIFRCKKNYAPTTSAETNETYSGKKYL
jgi:hypothetical protein